MQSVGFTAFDTAVNIRVDAPEDVAQAALAGCKELCERYEHLLSRFDETGPLWRLNHAAGERVGLPEELARFLEAALGYCERSKGRFDITMGSVCRLWDFHNGIVPSREGVAQALSHVGWRGVHVDGCTAWLEDSRAWVDLGGVAKGYIADRVGEHLEQCGVTSGIVNLGGNILTIGSKADGRPWRIGIRAPRHSGENGDERPVTVVEVRGKSVVTSGTYERAFAKDGVTYHHILDTKTGFPVQTDLVSATVVSERSIDGDGYSTTLLALGREGALRFAQEHPQIEVVLVTNSGEVVRS